MSFSTQSTFKLIMEYRTTEIKLRLGDIDHGGFLEYLYVPMLQDKK